MTKKTTLRHTANAPGIYPLEPVTACVLLTERASLFKLLWDGHPDSKPEAIPCGPSDWLGGAIVKAKHWPDVRELLAIAECPYPRADGTIVTAAGYDPETGILHCPSIALPDLPDAPTRETARAAADRILAHFEQFPFAAPADKAAFLASLLTHVARPTIDGPVPGFAFNGNKAGTGKGLLVDAIGVITTGRPAAAMDYPEKEEAAKVLTSLALAGTPAVHFDNLPSGATYGGSALDRGLTARTVDGRILGQSATTGPIRLCLCWDLTGNNLSPGYDAYRRWIPVNLKSSLESPEMRGDVKEKDFRSYLLKHRGTILRDVLTIFRAHALAGRPDAADSRMGSFEAWDATVRGAVTFAIGTDPLKTLRAAAEEAPERLDRLALIQAWRTLPGGERPGDGLTAAEAGKLAAPDRESGVSKYPVYYDVLLRLGRDGKPATPGSIGNRIRGMKHNNTGGFMFESNGLKHQAQVWRVALGESGSLGESENKRQGETRNPQIHPSMGQIHVLEKVKGNGDGFQTPTDSQTPLKPVSTISTTDCDPTPADPGPPPAPPETRKTYICDHCFITSPGNSCANANCRKPSDVPARSDGIKS